MSICSFRCHLYNLFNCLARIRVSPDGEYQLRGTHEHRGNLTLVQEYRFINECKNRASTEVGSMREIFNAVLGRLYFEKKSLFILASSIINIYVLLIYSRFPGVRVTFPSIERSMLRARRENQPAVPHSIADAVASMEANPRFRYVTIFLLFPFRKYLV